MTDENVESKKNTENTRSNQGSDISRLSQSGNSLYELLDIPKESSEQEIKRKYRRLALKYHPDKNPGNEEAEEMFKKINQAHVVLMDQKKRSIYDKYGSFGLYIADQVGEENIDIIDSLMILKSAWFKILCGFCFFLSGCCCCCCFLCCCNCCCGKCKPKADDEENPPNLDDLDEDEDIVTAQPSGLDSSSTLPRKESEARATPSSSKLDTGEMSPLKHPAAALPSYDTLVIENEK